MVRKEDAKRTTPKQQRIETRTDLLSGLTVKRCAACGIEKPLDEFRKGDGAGGRTTHCRACLRVENGTQRTYYSPRFDPKCEQEVKQCSSCHEAKQLNEYYKGASACKACRLADNKLAYQADPTKAKAASRKRRQQHPEKVREENARWLQRNKDRMLEYRKCNAHLHRESARRRRARQQGACIIEAIDRHAIIMRDRYTCYLCGEVLSSATRYPDPKSIVLDHVVPLSKGGTHTSENLRVACNRCNGRKHTSSFDELNWVTPSV